MTREEYEVFRDNNLKERFVLVQSNYKRKYLMEKGFRFLFRCTHYKDGKPFWVFDRSDELLTEMEAYDAERKSVMKVSDPVATDKS